MGFFDSLGKVFGIGDKFSPSPYGQGNPQFKPGQYSSGIPLPDRVSPLAPKLGAYRNLNPYAAKQVGPLQEYDAIKNRLNQRTQATNNEANDAITRRYAALNAVGSGSYQKALEQQQQAYQSQQVQNEQEVGFAEAQARRALQEQENQRQFGSEESYKQREFAASQGEREATLGVDQFNADLAFRQNMAAFESNSKLRALDLAGYQAEMGARDSAFNKDLAQYTAKNQGGLLGAGGFLGTGLFK